MTTIVVLGVLATVLLLALGMQGFRTQAEERSRTWAAGGGYGVGARAGSAHSPGYLAGGVVVSGADSGGGGLGDCGGGGGGGDGGGGGC